MCATLNSYTHMDLPDLILQRARRRDGVRARDLLAETGLSKTYVNRAFQQLRNEGRIVLIGQTNRARYVAANREAVARARRELVSIRKKIRNAGLSEDSILDELRLQTGIFVDLEPNVDHVLEYAFTELLNNAIEH